MKLYKYFWDIWKQNNQGGSRVEHVLYDLNKNMLMRAFYEHFTSILWAFDILDAQNQLKIAFSKNFNNDSQMKFVYQYMFTLDTFYARVRI